jgi:hypothetical protein
MLGIYILGTTLHKSSYEEGVHITIGSIGEGMTTCENTRGNLLSA